MSTTTLTKENSSPATSLFSGEPFERLVAILIALVTLLAAIAGFLQADAGARADRANRNAQRFAVQAMGRRISGVTRVGYDWSDAYQTWYQLDTLAFSAGNTGDNAATARYNALRDRIVGLSSLLTAPYFDPGNQAEPDVAGYEADLYLVEATALAERYATQAELDNAWGDKSKTYVAHLTVLAVTLFLFGLSTTIAGRTRWIFLGVGVFVTLITMLWMLVVLIKPIPTLPDAAIVAYARGVGLAYQEDFEEALLAFDQALAEAPTYANALYERGNARYSLEKYEAAAADFEAARSAGRDDLNVAWNLGWTYYLLGHFDDAVQTDRQVLDLNPDQVGLHFNLALALLAGDQIEIGQTEYANAMAVAQRQVVEARAAGLEPSSSLWWYLDAAVRDLDSLIDRLDHREKYWTEGPAPETIANGEAVKGAAQTQSEQLRDLTVALEYTGQPPTGPVTAQVSPFNFGQSRYDEAGNFLDYDLADSFPYLTDEVLVLFDQTGIQDGQETVMKVYRDGVEDPSLRLVADWALGSSGSVELPLSYAYSNVFVFSSGEYTVELYVDSHLVQRGSFVIEEP